MPDRSITCADCGQDFVFTEREQEWFREKGLTNDPRRCKPCRTNRKGGGGGGGGGGGHGGGGGGHGGGGHRGPRSGGRSKEMFQATCAACGKGCEVPFQPDESRPVYCRDCFDTRGKRR